MRPEVAWQVSISRNSSPRRFLVKMLDSHLVVQSLWLLKMLFATMVSEEREWEAGQSAVDLWAESCLARERVDPGMILASPCAIRSPSLI